MDSEVIHRIVNLQVCRHVRMIPQIYVQSNIPKFVASS